jgi:hypothetical protein
MRVAFLGQFFVRIGCDWRRTRLVDGFTGSLPDCAWATEEISATPNAEAIEVRIK